MAKRARAKSSRAKHVRGNEAQQQKEKAFLELVERFRAASDPGQVRWLAHSFAFCANERGCDATRPCDVHP